MDSIQLYINRDKILWLEFQDAVHPTLVHPKADHWNFIYKLYCDQTLFDCGLYNNNYFVCEQQQILIIEEYNNVILDKDNINVDIDVIKNLRLFDFKKNKTGKFSKLAGNSFILHRLIGNKFIFSKKYLDRTSEFEIELSNIQLFDFGRL
jgi:hypothetical protein